MTDYNLHDKVPIAGFYTDDGPKVELGAIQVVPEGAVIVADEPTLEEEYERKARVELTPKEADEVAEALQEMAKRVSTHPDS